MTRGSSASRRQKALVVAAFVAGSAVRTLAPRRPRCLSRGVLARRRSGAQATPYALVQAHQRTILEVCEIPHMTTYPPASSASDVVQLQKHDDAGGP